MRIRITPNNECISFRPDPCILSYSFQVNLLESEGSTTNPVPYTTIQGMKMNNKVIQIFKSTLRADCRACSQFLKTCLFRCRSAGRLPTFHYLLFTFLTTFLPHGTSKQIAIIKFARSFLGS